MTGNMLIAQSGGPSMVINQSLVGAVLAAKTSEKIVNIYGALHGIQGIFDEDFIDLRAEPEDVLLQVAQTPSSALGSVRRKPTADDCKTIFTILAKHDIRYFFYIGGNDSAETANIIAQEAEKQGYDLCCYHIPKTIDNDLLCNDHTPGYGSAGRFVACAVRGDDLDNRALGGVKIDVIMGRNAGFLTAAAALAKQDEDDGPHLVYVPERTFSVDQFVADVGACMEKYGRCVVAVSEGIRGADGRAIAESFSTETDAHGNVQLTSGALGENLAAVIRDRLKVKRVRADTFGFIQRCFVGITSESDACEARRVGEVAVHAAITGAQKSGTVTMTRLPGDAYEIEYGVAPLSAVAKFTRELPDNYINEAGNNVTEAFIRYARPIVGDLPVTARFTQLRGRS